MKFLYSILLLFCSLAIFSQQDEINKCDHDEWLQAIEETIPGYNLEIKKSFDSFKKRKKSDSRAGNITIPVHVIVVHSTGQAIGSGSNHSLAHVQSQIDVLNQDFGRYNSDAGNTPDEFPAADTGIQFCLASVDPDGNPTDGITRYAFDGAFHPNSSSIRQDTRWPRESYSNIWSAPNLPYLGLASVPNTFSLPSANNDFIHVDAATFGGPGFATQPNYNLGRTTTHEMGHWLGLFHVWANDGCGNDDGIDDTPVQDDENFGCPNHPSPSCSNGGDMFMNYMDYVNDNCMNAFTQEQGEYMNTILSTSRASLNGSAFTACATSVPLVLNVTSQSDPNCVDSNDGFILVEASGGEPDYSYTLNDGAPTTNNLFSDLAGGNYVIEVFDANGNSTSVTVFLNTPVPITATINVNQTNTCPSEMTGIIEILVAGGSNPYSYSLNMGIAQESNIFENLSNGFYVVNVVDNNGCTYEDSFELTGANAITITIDSTQNLTCGNDDTGLIIASAEGGVGPLSYSINGFDYQDNGEFLELDGGSYFVFVQDSTGCYDSLEVVILEPDPFFISLESTDASCFGLSDGFVEVNAFGGNGSPFQFSFDSLTFGDITMLDSLSAGEYDLYALDSLGCLAIATFDIEEPDEIQILADAIINVNCFGESNGMLDLSATGGNGDYTFILQGDSTDLGDFSDLTVGIYDVDVVDASGCVGNASFEVGLNSNITLAIENQQSPSCFGGLDGSIQVMAENAVGSVSYSINEGMDQDSPLFEGLGTGDYIVTAQDSAGCSATFTVTLDEPLMMLVEISTTNVSCNGESDGSVTTTVTGGTLPYQYSFEPSDADPNGLASGMYTVTITDEKGCFIFEEFEITEPDALTLSVISQGEIECGTEMGTLLEIEAQGGSGGDYNYSLIGPTGSISNADGVFDETLYGKHIVSVTDANNCTTEMEVLITYENMFYAEIQSIGQILCFGDLGGSIEIFVQGGLGEVTYLLDGALEVDLNKLETHSGDHFISVIDENDCLIELPFTLDEPEELVVDAMVIDNDLGTVTVIASGGTEPYEYSFDDGITFMDSNVLDDITSSLITVIVKDANGCEVESSIIINYVKDLEAEWIINAYPNPFQEELFIDFNFPSQLEVSIEIFDIEGRRIHNVSPKKYKSGNNFVKIDLSNFASSIYIVKIASAEGYRYIKVTKM